MWDNFSLRSFSMMTRWPMRTNFKSWCSHFKSKCSWFSACFHELHSAHENCLHNTVLNSWQVLGFILWVYESQTTSWPNKTTCKFEVGHCRNKKPIISHNLLMFCALTFLYFFFLHSPGCPLSLNLQSSCPCLCSAGRPGKLFIVQENTLFLPP